jgi:hypothetical protein
MVICGAAAAGDTAARIKRPMAAARALGAVVKYRRPDLIRMIDFPKPQVA